MPPSLHVACCLVPSLTEVQHLGTTAVEQTTALFMSMMSLGLVLRAGILETQNRYGQRIEKKEKRYVAFALDTSFSPRIWGDMLWYLAVCPQKMTQEKTSNMSS